MSAIGTPLGMKMPKKWVPWRIRPTMMTVRMTSIASAKVTMMWLVTVKK
jgi:hypothetical protein